MSVNVLLRWIVVAALGAAGVSCSNGRREPRSDERGSGDAAAAAAAAVADPLAGKWVELSKNGAFVVAICVIGPDPSIGSLGSPEHSSTRDPAVVKAVACPAPLPEVPPPGRGDQVLAARNAIVLGQAKTDDAPVELVTIVEPGAMRSLVRTASDEVVELDNARLVALPAGATARPGDIVLGFHPEVGVVRGLVLEGGTASAPLVMRLRGFGSGYFGELTLAAGSFRPVKQDLDPGSLVAIPLTDRVELALVLGSTDAFVVTLDDDDRVRALHRTSLVAMPVAPRPKKGQRVWARFVTGLEAARINGVHDGHITAAFEDFPDDEKWFGDGGYIDRDLSLGLYTKIDLD